MSKDIAKIRNKSVYLSEPYQVPPSEIVGRDQEMTKILTAWMCGRSSLPLSPLLLGEPGVGKNRIVYECAKLCGKELYICPIGDEDTTAEELVCTGRISDDLGKKMDYIASPLVTAMLLGGVCFVDEIGKIGSKTLKSLASLLDERRYVDSTLLGERVYAHRGFRFVAATNSDDLDQRPLEPSIDHRLRPKITINHPNHEEIEQIVRGKFNGIIDNGADLLRCFWELWEKQGGNRPPTPRDSLYIFGYATNLADFEATRGHLPYDLNQQVGAEVTEEHLVRAFEECKDSVGRKRNDHTTRNVPLAQ